MADYIYLLENRLSTAQQQALHQVREAARAKAMNVFLAGGAVRDLTSGSPVRDLDVSVQGNALKLKKDIEKTRGVLVGEHEASQTLFFKFPGGVRVEVSSTRTESYPKPGKPVYHPADLKQDLYRRDFTANAMALSLNDGSYGLLIDPMNGVADIESRYLRLVSNYGFIEEPSRLIRATRLIARLGWQMDEKTQARYETAKEENYISALSEHSRGYELEEVVHEEDPLRALIALENEGWMKHMFPAWTSAKANTAGLHELHNTLMKLQMQGVSPDASAANFHLLTAKLGAKEVAELKASFARPGFVKEIESLDSDAKDFAKLLMSKESASPSATWKLLTSHPAEAVLWLAYTSKNAAVQTKFNNFFVVWPEARQKYPYLMMQEMRITPQIAGYDELLQTLFFEMMDGKLQTPEQMKAFLEPFSPPAPPPTVHLRRPRAVKKAEAKPSRKKAAAKAAAESEAAAVESIAAAGEAATLDTSPTQAVAAKAVAAKKRPLGKGEAAEPGVQPAEPAKAAAATRAGAASKAVSAAKPAASGKAAPVASAAKGATGLKADAAKMAKKPDAKAAASRPASKPASKPVSGPTSGPAFGAKKQIDAARGQGARSLAAKAQRGKTPPAKLAKPTAKPVAKGAQHKAAAGSTKASSASAHKSAGKFRPIVSGSATSKNGGASKPVIKFPKPAPAKSSSKLQKAGAGPQKASAGKSSPKKAAPAQKAAPRKPGLQKSSKASPVKAHR